MSRQSDESKETHEVLHRFIRVAVATPLVLLALLALGIHQFEIELTSAVIRHGILGVWLLTMAALGCSLWHYLRSERQAPNQVHVVKRMDWETKQSHHTTSELLRALLILPSWTVLDLFLYHTYWQPFQSHRDLRLIAVVALAGWLLVLICLAYTSRKQRIG